MSPGQVRQPVVQWIAIDVDRPMPSPARTDKRRQDQMAHRRLVSQVVDLDSDIHAALVQTGLARAKSPGGATQDGTVRPGEVVGVTGYGTDGGFHGSINPFLPVGWHLGTLRALKDKTRTSSALRRMIACFPRRWFYSTSSGTRCRAAERLGAPAFTSDTDFARYAEPLPIRLHAPRDTPPATAPA